MEYIIAIYHSILSLNINGCAKSKTASKEPLLKARQIV
jgi:hypothetical protein